MIGAGVGGLACAARLAAAGVDVVVVEQAPQVGGKLGIHRAGGFTWDTGPSLLTMPWVLEETLAATGGRLRRLTTSAGRDEDDARAQHGRDGRAADPRPAEEATIVARALDPIARYRFGDGTWLDAAADDERFRATLDDQLHPGAGQQWHALMDRAARVWEASAEAILQRPLRGLVDLAPLLRRPRAVAAVAPHRTLRSLGREYLSDPRLRMLLDRYATYTGSDPRRAPAALVTVAYAERRWGGWYVEGGLRRIAEVLAGRVIAHGGEVRCGVAVTRITLDDCGRADGVVLADGTRLRADAVVANADAAHVVGSLLAGGGAQRSAGAKLRRRLRVAPRSLSGYVLLLGVRDTTPPPAHHTVLFPRAYDPEFDALFGASGQPPRYVDDPTIYLAVPDDPAVAPPGHRAWFVLVNAPRTDQVAHPPPGYAERILALMAAREVDVRADVVQLVQRTPADLERETSTPGGAIYGTSSNGPLAAFLRPPNVTDVEGLLLVGGSSHPGGGLPLVLLSAKIVADQLLA